MLIFIISDCLEMTVESWKCKTRMNFVGSSIAGKVNFGRSEARIAVET